MGPTTIAFSFESTVTFEDTVFGLNLNRLSTIPMTEAESAPPAADLAPT